MRAMDYTSAQTYLLKKSESQETFPFGSETAVYKIRHKMFALLIWEKGIAHMNLKCDPDEALALRDIFPAVTPGYHMNKKHWNTVILDGSIPKGELERMIDNSYLLVIEAMPTTQRPTIIDR